MRFTKIFSTLVVLLVINVSAFAQNKKVKLPANWYNLDLGKDGYFGISTEKAYLELLKNKAPKQKVIVAVIDGGVDINHEDLKDILWTNTKEIAGNGIDDDGNGYVDDVHGWNFLGSKGNNLAYDNLEMVRIIRKYQDKYKSTLPTTALDSTEKEEYFLYDRARREFGIRYNEADESFRWISMINHVIDSVARINNKALPSAEDIEKYVADSEEEVYVKKFIRSGIKDAGSDVKYFEEMKETYRQYDVMLKYNLNMNYDKRKELVGDNYSNSEEKIYGNNDVAGPNPDHGSHVAGIIAASRNNNIGINGIANSVSIMAIRVVPEGDERDKDVANGIRYAVDNGAKIINMSFGKGFKWDKKVVDEAIKYAEEKGVLLVHAAGNENQNNDITENYPNKYYDSPEALAYQKKNRKEISRFPVRTPDQSQRPSPTMGRYRSAIPKKVEMDTTKFAFPHASNWIEVGASAYANDATLKASFSNYGKHIVDVFAPGFMINSTVPGSKYKENDGTSMASPVVAGLAALVLGYYPELSPAQLRDIIIKSVVKVPLKVKHKNEKGESIRIAFSDLSVSGGIVNAYNALKLAESYSTTAKTN
ncbi:MAG: peptidase S8 [Pedobacter sp.]|nr:MAG: peptidase S8 [Pedobacter sp.]